MLSETWCYTQSQSKDFWKNDCLQIKLKKLTLKYTDTLRITGRPQLYVGKLRV